MREYLPMTVWLLCGVFGIWNLRMMRDVSILDILLMLVTGPIVTLWLLGAWASDLTVLKRKGRE